MANIANDLSSISGTLIKQYAPTMVKLVPVVCLLQQYAAQGDPVAGQAPAALKIRWADVARLGDTFQFPTKIQSGHGVSYNGSGGSVVALEDALNLKVVQAAVIGFEIVNRQQMSYSAAYAGDDTSKKAVETSAKLMLEDLKDVAYAVNEMSGLFGQSLTVGYGVLESQSIATVGGKDVMTAIFTPASFSPGWWVANIGARVEFADTSGNVTPTQASTVFATVASVNISTRTVAFILSGSGWNSVTVPAAGSVAHMKGSLTTGGTFNEQIGLFTQLSATSGTYFGLDRSLAGYSLLQGQTFSAGNARLTKAKVIQAATLPINKGNMRSMVLLVGTSTWADLAAEDLASRIFDSSYSGAQSKSGSRELVYENLNGQIRVVCHPFMQAGLAFLFTEEDVSWIGSTDVTFKLPNGQDLFRLVDGYNAYESQCVSNKQIYHCAPGKAVVINNIVNSF